MAKMEKSGSYINDFPPVETVRDNLTEEEVKDIARAVLGVVDLEYMTGDQWIENKFFVDLGPPNENGITEALYNHDGRYSIRTYKKPMQ